MTPGDMARLLGHCAYFDYRDIDEELTAAWYAAIGDLDYTLAINAVVHHYSESTERIMPAHIRRIVRQAQAELSRNEPHAVRELPSRFEDDINREVRMKRGVANTRQILAPLLARIARDRPELPTAVEELRAITADPLCADSAVSDEANQ